MKTDVETETAEQDAGGEKHVFDSEFNDSSANIILKSSDGVLFRAHDFYLKASSGFFRDMLIDSGFTSSVDKPIKLDEHSQDIKTLLIVISGHPCRAEERCESWKDAKRLYLLMQKYQLDRLQSWFSHVAGNWAEEAPFEALCLACNNPCFDENLARCAILDGLEEKTAAFLFDPLYFVEDMAAKDENDRKLALLDPYNTTIKFSLDLGYKGYVAYCRSFSIRECDAIFWKGAAQRFINTVRWFERERETAGRVVRKVIVPTTAYMHSKAQAVLYADFAFDWHGGLAKR